MNLEPELILTLTGMLLSELYEQMGPGTVYWTIKSIISLCNL